MNREEFAKITTQVMHKLLEELEDKGASTKGGQSLQ